MKRTELLRAARIKSAWSAGQAADTVTDYLPFIGAGKDMWRGAQGISNGVGQIFRGNIRQGLGAAAKGFGQQMMGNAFMAADVFTGGLAGSAGKLALKGGVKGLAHVGGKAFAKALPYTAGAEALNTGVGRMMGGGRPNAPAPQPAATREPGLTFNQGGSSQLGLGGPMGMPMNQYGPPFNPYAANINQRMMPTFQHLPQPQYGGAYRMPMNPYGSSFG
jgi:hypothetical protein